MKGMKWGLGAAGAILAAGALILAVAAVAGTAQAEEPGKVSRLQEILAQKLGISVDQLRTAETTARNQLADELLAAGKITQAQADKIKGSELGSGLARLRGAAHGGRGMKIAVNAVEVTAKVSNVTVETVKQELVQGKSLAQIAGEHGVGRDALKAAIAAAQKTALQEAVGAGKITQAHADQMTQKLSEHLDQLIDHTGGHSGTMDGMRKMHGATTP